MILKPKVKIFGGNSFLKMSFFVPIRVKFEKRAKISTIASRITYKFCRSCAVWKSFLDLPAYVNCYYLKWEKNGFLLEKNVDKLFVCDQVIWYFRTDLKLKRVPIIQTIRIQTCLTSDKPGILQTVPEQSKLSFWTNRNY